MQSPRRTELHNSSWMHRRYQWYKFLTIFFIFMYLIFLTCSYWKCNSKMFVPVPFFGLKAQFRSYRCFSLIQVPLYLFSIKPKTISMAKQPLIGAFSPVCPSDEKSLLCIVLVLNLCICSSLKNCCNVFFAVYDQS